MVDVNSRGGDKRGVIEACAQWLPALRLPSISKLCMFELFYMKTLFSNELCANKNLASFALGKPHKKAPMQ